jgi:hypothetical protein
MKASTAAAVGAKWTTTAVSIIVALATAAVVGDILIHNLDRGFRVTKVSLVANPSEYAGPCPTTILFEGTITTNGKGSVEYTFIRDGKDIGPRRTLHFEKAASKEVGWEIEFEDSAEGWLAIQTISPREKEWQPAHFEVINEEGRSAVKPECNLIVSEFRPVVSGQTITVAYALELKGRLQGDVELGLWLAKGPRGDWIRKWNLPSSRLERLNREGRVVDRVQVERPDWGEGSYDIAIRADVDDRVRDTYQRDNSRETSFSIIE